jgi:hypothetical protein
LYQTHYYQSNINVVPTYTYYCEANGKTVEVNHTVNAKLKTWGELCFVSQIPLGETDPLAEVKRIIVEAPGVSVQTFNSELKNAGFTKLVKRDQGIYENVTAIEGEKRYMKSDEKDSLPHLNKKIRD